MTHFHLVVCKLIRLRKQLCHDTSFRKIFFYQIRKVEHIHYFMSLPTFCFYLYIVLKVGDDM